MPVVFKGSVSRTVRHRLLYIIRKLYIKPLSADHFYLFLLKGYAAIDVKKSQRLANIFTPKDKFLWRMLVSRSAMCHSLWSLYVRFEGERCFSIHNLFKGKSTPISSTLRWTFSFEEIMYVWWAIFGSLHKLEMFCHSFPLQRPLRGDHNLFKINSKYRRKMFAKRWGF